MKRTTLAAVALSAFGLVMGATAFAAEPAVLRVIVVQTTDVAAYEHELEVVAAIYKKLGVKVAIEAYRALYAGPEAGAIALSIEVPNLAALAKMNEMQRTQPEIMAEMKKIAAMRKIVSDSVYEKLTP